MILRAIRRLLRRAVATLGGLLLGSRLFQRARISAGAHQRILVIRIDERVGNVLLTTPLLTALALARPSAQIDALIAASKTALVEGLANVIPFERRNFFRRPITFLRDLLRLRRTRYDVAIDASHWHELSVTSAMLLAWTGAPIRIAHNRKEARLYATALVDPTPGAHEITAKLALLQPLEIPTNPSAKLVTHVGENGPARARIATWLTQNNLDRAPLVALAPGSRKLDHRASADLFARLGRESRSLGATPIVLWGPGEETLAAEVARAGEATLAPPTDLPELAALMRACRVVISNDTGPMHLSVACGAPTIALFIHGDHQRWGHAHPPNVVVQAASRPLDDVGAEVSAALRKILGIAEPTL